MSIIDTSRVKGVLGIPAGVTFHDTAIGYAVDFANSRVLRALGQQQLAVTTTQEYPVVYNEAQESVLLRHTPVVQIVACTNDDSLLVQDEDFWLDTEDIGALRLMKGAGHWSWERQGVKVLYTWGYTSATLPTEVLHAAEAIAVSAYNRGKHAGLTQRSASGYSYQLSDQDLPPDARAVLARYEDAHR